MELLPVLVLFFLAAVLLFNFTMTLRHHRRMMAYKDATIASNDRVIALKDDMIASQARTIASLEQIIEIKQANIETLLPYCPESVQFLSKKATVN